MRSLLVGYFLFIGAFFNTTYAIDQDMTYANGGRFEIPSGWAFEQIDRDTDGTTLLPYRSVDADNKDIIAVSRVSTSGSLIATYPVTQDSDPFPHPPLLVRIGAGYSLLRPKTNNVNGWPETVYLVNPLDEQFAIDPNKPAVILPDGMDRVIMGKTISAVSNFRTYEVYLFGPNGIKKLTDDFYDSCFTIDHQDRVVTSEETRDSNGKYATKLLRFTSQGELDPSFGNGGEILLSSRSSDDYTVCTAMAADQSGYILHTQVSRRKAVLRRVDNFGQVDNTFGTAGFLDSPSSEASLAYSDASGRVLFRLWLNSKTTLMRLDSNGNVDETFGPGGLASFPIAVASDSHLLSPGGSSVMTFQRKNDLLGVVKFNLD